MGFPRTWCWGDAKWDHIGCRADGSAVLIEWSSELGLAGNDLYLALFLPQQRRQELFTTYLSAFRAINAGVLALEEYLRLGLLRTCYLRGPGQAVLSIRGFAGGGSSEVDKAAWEKDAAVTADAIIRLESGQFPL